VSVSDVSASDIIRLRGDADGGTYNLVGPLAAEATTCGAGQPHKTCQCADIVAADYTMSADLSTARGDT
jgi:hypothetical protein